MNSVARRLLASFGFVSFALPVAACGSSTSGGAGGSAPASLCDTDPRAMKYAAGLSQKTVDGALKVSLTQATPAPPALNENAWTVTITDGSGNPVSDATITVKPWMPDMGHGSSVTPQVMPMSNGTYQITLLDLFMPGIWTNTFTISTPSTPATTAVFTFCIDG
jgi:hypothetical protein